MAKGALHYVYARHDQVQETLDHYLIKGLLKGTICKISKALGL
ncbi:hypothetical protein I311_06951 [Cryptococcus gattii NT-10]|nr:hypothetical protein I311_06951 [Cryptococcus gattii NT-10]